LSTYSRTEPFLAKIQERFLLNKMHATKATYHISLSVNTAHFPFRVGDSLGVFAQNDPVLVDSLLQILCVSGEEEILDPKTGKSISLLHFFSAKANLAKCTSSLLKLLHQRGASKVADLLLPEKKEMLQEWLRRHDLLDCLLQFPSRVTAEELAPLLLPLMPRFYSISSSPLMFPHEIHLTVASLEYEMGGKRRHGVGSLFLCQTAQIQETPIPIYVQPSNGFTIPQDPESSIIFIGPGTGIAPFRAFMQERMALQHKGRNWLFFGERNHASDFYYEEYWTALQKEGRLRLSLAFSRDQPEKIYVQHRLWQERKSVWDWIQQGASIYLCGDANRMAPDVESMLQQIGVDVGQMNEAESSQWLRSLRKTKRFLLDVY
jgi:sulfite reductase (NADPH) flavoprotein alpha-component